MISAIISHLLFTLFGLAIGWAGAMIWLGNKEADVAEDTLPDGQEVTAHLTLTPREVLAIEVCLDRLDALGMPGYAAKAKAKDSARSAVDKLRAVFLPKDEAVKMKAPYFAGHGENS